MTAERLAGGLVIVAHLHRGRRADVYEVQGERGETLIAKVVRPELRGDPVAVERLRLEGERLARVSHPAVLRFVRPLEDPPGSLLEHVPGRTLDEHLRGGGRLTWHAVATLGTQLASALGAVHASGLVHCDVKPLNVLVGRDRYVLIDLDVACAPGVVGRGHGTRVHCAPEVARDGLVGPAADAWGLGLVLFRAATGKPAFPRHDGYPQLDMPARRVAPLRDGGGEIEGLIEALLAPDPAARPDLAAVAAALATEAAHRAPT